MRLPGRGASLALPDPLRLRILEVVRPGLCRRCVRAVVGRRSAPLIALVFLGIGAAVGAAEVQGTTSRNELRLNHPEGYRLSRWAAEDGLPQNTATALLQARDGYLWLGTRYGLVRYDGIRFVTFQAELGADSEAFDCRGLAEDSQGRLWIHTAAGLLCRTGGVFKRVLRPEDLKEQEIAYLAPRQSGGIWVLAPHSIHAVEGPDSAPQRALTPPPKQYLERLLPAESGAFWIRSWDHDYRESPLWWHWDPATGTFSSAAHHLGSRADQALYIHTSPSGRTWVLRRHEISWRIGMEEQSASATEAWSDRQIKSVADGMDGSLWIVSDGQRQLHCYREDQLTSITEADGVLGSTDVRAVLPDREGNLWVGTGSEGLQQLQQRRVFSTLLRGQAHYDEVHSICTGPENRVWLARRGGVFRLQRGEAKSFRFDPTEFRDRDLIQRFSVVTETSDGMVWAGFAATGLMVLEDGAMQPVLEERDRPSKDWDINSFFEDRQGRFWVGSSGGLHRRVTGKIFAPVTHPSALRSADVRGLAESPDGTVWAGTSRRGLAALQGGEGRMYTQADGLLSDTVWPLLAETNGAVWIGTPAGLNRIHQGRISAVTIEHGLFDNLAYCLLEDGRGRYWSFGNRGIWRVRKDELNAVADGRSTRLHCVRFGTSDGMVSLEGNGDQQPSAARMPNGEFWFPTTRGVVIVNPETIRDNQVIPPVSIEQVSVDGEVVLRDGESPPREPMTLAPGRARVVEVQYTAATFVDGDRARFRFRLLGHDADWREADTRRSTSYTNLRPGPHRFQVKACNNHGYWNEQPAEFAFVLLPHFYETWTFRISAALGLVGIALGLHLRRVRVLHRVQQLRQDQAMNLERSRIARDLHDELGGNLTGLAFKLGLARQKVAPDHPASGTLQGLEKEARAFGEQLRQVVWLVDSGRDTVEDLAAFLCQFVPQFLDDAGLRCTLDVPPALDARFLSAEARHQLLLIVKEALHNAVRHARASEVVLRLGVQNGELRLAVEDDGCGFPSGDLPSRTYGQGLASMQRRGRALGGTCAFENRPEGGARVEVRLRLPPQKNIAPPLTH